MKRTIVLPVIVLLLALIAFGSCANAEHENCEMTYEDELLIKITTLEKNIQYQERVLDSLKVECRAREIVLENHKTEDYE